MSTHRVFQRNGNIVVEQVGGTIKIKTDGVTPPPDPVFSGVPNSPSGFGLSAFSNFSINRAVDPICEGTQASDRTITFQWNINDQDNDPLHYYAIRRVPTAFIGVDDTATGYPSGTSGQYGLEVSGVVSGALDMVTNFEPYTVDSISGINGDVTAVTSYGSNSIFYQYGFSSSNTPKYKNGLGITSIEFSNNSVASPKITFRDNTEKTRFRGLGGSSGPLMRLFGATGDMGDYSFAWNGTSGDWDLSISNITSETSTSITYNAMTSGALSDLLDDITARGTNNQWLYIQLTTDDLFTGQDFNQRCVYSTDIESPLILRRDILTEYGNEYKITVQDYDCDNFGFQMLAVNPSGQSTPEYTGIAKMTEFISSWTIKEATEASIYDSGGTDFGVQYGGSNGFEGYFVVPTGYVSTMLYASGFIYDHTDNLISTASSSNSGGTGGKLNFTKPSQGWYYATAQEQWRLSGPSGEIIQTISSERCGDNFQYVVT